MPTYKGSPATGSKSGPRRSIGKGNLKAGKSRGRSLIPRRLSNQNANRRRMGTFAHGPTTGRKRVGG